MKSNAWARRLEKPFHFLAKLLGEATFKNVQIPIPSRILVLKACCFGDAILSLYAIRAFKLAHPNSEIHVLCTDRIREVYQLDPNIHSVYTLSLSGKNLLNELFSFNFIMQVIFLFKKIRDQHFNWFIDMELYRPYGPFLRAIFGIPYSVGFYVEGLRRPAHSALIFRGRKSSEWKLFYGLFGLQEPNQKPDILFPRHSEGKKEAFSTQRTLRIGFVFGASFNWPAKRWPSENFSDLIHQLNKTGIHAFLLGAPYEKILGEQIRNRCPPSTELWVNPVPLQEWIQKLHTLDAVVGNDTGMTHFAAAAGIKTLTLFGPTEPEKWSSPGSKALFLPSLSCRPCYYLGQMPNCDHFSCLKGLHTSEVEAALRVILETV